MHRTTTDGEVTPHEALGFRRARIVAHARVHALAVDAGVFRRAFVGASAADDATRHERVALEAGSAAARGHVALHIALAVDGAQVLEETGVYAILVHAGLVRGALRVVLALDWEAGYAWFALVAFLAEADGLVVLDVALRVAAAVAGVPASPVHA